MLTNVLDRTTHTATATPLAATHRTAFLAAKSVGVGA